MNGKGLKNFIIVIAIVAFLGALVTFLPTTISAEDTAGVETGPLTDLRRTPEDGLGGFQQDAQGSVTMGGNCAGAAHDWNR